MATIRFGDATVALRPGETVLEGLERVGERVPSSCRSGTCQTCAMVAIEGVPPSPSQQGLKQTQRDRGYFLACVCRPDGDMAVRLPDDVQTFEAAVVDSRDAGAAVRIVRFAPPKGFSWRAGQYATLMRGDGLSRCYSIASLPEDGHAEIHVRRIPGGAMSGWIHDSLRPGDRVALRGPLGECFFATPCEAETTLLLAGTGTGLAPLVGIARDALARGHAGPIRLFHGALREAGLYFRDELAAMAAAHGNVRVQACVLEGRDGAGVRVGALDEIVLAALDAPRTTRAYLCGDPALVGKLKKRLFLAGMSSRAIFADAFVATAAPTGAP